LCVWCGPNTALCTFALALCPQDTLADAERSFLSFATPIVTFVQDTTFKAFSITDSFVSGDVMSSARDARLQAHSGGQVLWE
jgi:hypothetical protein